MKESEMLAHLQKTIPDLIKSPGLTDGYDCKSDEKKLFIELKSRKKFYDTLLLEEKKYDYLIEESAKLGYEPQYINWTPEGTWLFILNPDKETYKWEDKWLPRTTEFGTSGNVTKRVTMIHIKDGDKLW